MARLSPDSTDGGLGTGGTRGGNSRKFQYALGFSQIVGKHELKYGAQLKPRYLEVAGWSGRLGTGLYEFRGDFTQGPDPLLPSPNTGNAFADLTLGLISGGEFPILPENHSIAEQYAWYFEDTWRVTPRLTLNLGLRYDFSMPGWEVDNRNARFDPLIANPLGEMTGPNTNGQTLNEFVGRPLLGGVVFAGSPANDGKKRITATDFSNIAPRLGAAFKLNDKTLLRGGVAKLYWLTTYRALASPSINPFSASTPIVGAFDGIHPALEITNVFPGGIGEPTGAARGALTNVGKALSGGVGGQKNPYSWQWNFGMQRELPANSLVTVSYLGSIGRRLACPFFYCGSGVGEDVLQRLGPALLDAVPNPFFGIVDPNGTLDTTAPLFRSPFVQRQQLEQEWPHYLFGTALTIPPPASNSGFGLFTEEYPFKNSWHGLTLGYEKRYSDGLQLTVALTAGKNLTNVDSFESGYLGPTAGYQNPRDLTKEKSLSAEDISYRLVINHVYDLPFGRGKKFGGGWHPLLNAIAGGWQLSGIWTFQSGFPLPILTQNSFGQGINNINQGWGGARPHLLSDPVLTKGSRGERIQQWVQPDAFRFPAPFTFGSAPRLLPIRGDGIKNFDVSIIKFFPIRERMNVEFRAEAFNLFNRPQFGLPDMFFGGPTFGRVFFTT